MSAGKNPEVTRWGQIRGDGDAGSGQQRAGGTSLRLRGARRRRSVDRNRQGHVCEGFLLIAWRGASKSSVRVEHLAPLGFFFPVFQEQ